MRTAMHVPLMMGTPLKIRGLVVRCDILISALSPKLNYHNRRSHCRWRVFIALLDSGIWLPWPLHDDFDERLVLGDHVRGQHAAPVGAWIYHRTATDDAARVEHGVAADLRAVAEERAEFAQASVERFAVHFHGHVSRQGFEIGQHRARAKMDLVAQDRV